MEHKAEKKLVMTRDENRNVECKESWHDKYFEWICGYANANADKDLPQKGGMRQKVARITG